MEPPKVTLVEPLRAALDDWQDFDVAAYALGRILGLFPSFDTPEKSWLEYKHIFWTDNHTGRTLHYLLLNLVKNGVLLHNEEEQRFKWNPDFKIEG